MFGYINDEKNLNKKGVGLGLNITNKIVNCLDGNITADSEYGKGTHIQFAIKLNQTSYH